MLNISLLSTGCGFIPLAPSPIDLAESKKIPQHESIVFGRIKVIVDGKTTDFGYPREGSYARIYLVSDTNLRPIPHNIRNDGTFYWHLAPRRYTITTFFWARGLSKLIRPVSAQFIVPEGSNNVYIGTLVTNLSHERAANYRLPDSIAHTYIEDDFSEGALQELQKYDFRIRQPVTKALMYLESAQ